MPQRLAKRTSKRTLVPFSHYSTRTGPDKLSPNHLRFVEEYMIDVDAANAAIRAGYAPNNAKVQGVQLLNRPLIATEIQKRMDARAKKMGIKAEDVVAELARLGFSNIVDYLTFDKHGNPKYDLKKISREQGAAIAELVIDDLSSKVSRLKLVSKTTPLELLGKHLGMFKENIILTGPDGGPIQVSNVKRTITIEHDSEELPVKNS